ncbi:alpha/beta fold hydrolase [Mycobacterium marinum]|uniref:alpha/beta fold hydrolase n=2 Tax=Mycobacterium marinum TaxID=1781 RepID=UPI0035625470
MNDDSELAEWISEQHWRQPVKSTAMTVADGGRFRVTRVGAGQGSPVVLLPGMFDNRRLYLWPGGGGLAEALADSGLDVWIVERRGAGGVAVDTGVRAGWEEMVRIDLPAVQRLIATHNGRPAFWVAHSFGGVALARAAAQTMQQAQVAGLVLVESAVDIPLLANRVVAATVQASMWRGMFPARLFRLGPEDEPVAAFQDAISWGRAERAGGELSAALQAVHVPALAITAPRDVIAPAGRCKRLAQAFGSADRRIQSAARRHGFARNHNHESPLLHPSASADVFPFLRDWFSARLDECPPDTAATAPVGRHRLQYTVELDAPPEWTFDVLTHHWATLWPVRHRRVRAGVHPRAPDGLRSVRAQRALGVWPIQEEIVGHRPARLIEYRTIRGPVRNHFGRIELTAVPGRGTQLDYSISFDTPAWLPGRLLAAVLDVTWRFYSLPRLRHQTGGG